MAASVEILTAIRELTNSKQIDRAELHGLLEDGINAALAKKHGPTVQAEVDIDESKGSIRIVLLKTVVEEVTDPASQISSRGRFEDADSRSATRWRFQLISRVRRTAVRREAADHPARQRRREVEDPRRFSSRVEICFRERCTNRAWQARHHAQQVPEAEAIIPYREQNHREHFHQWIRSAPC